MLSINAVKGFELGGGFEMTTKRGSEVKDEFYKEGDAVKTKANFSGGIQGGISNGQPIVFRVAFKPTATIGKEQSTIDKKGNAVLLEASGRHDPLCGSQSCAYCRNTGGIGNRRLSSLVEKLIKFILSTYLNLINRWFPKLGGKHAFLVFCHPFPVKLKKHQQAFFRPRRTMVYRI
jgi:hypothetical protein